MRLPICLLLCSGRLFRFWDEGYVRDDPVSHLSPTARLLPLFLESKEKPRALQDGEKYRDERVYFIRRLEEAAANLSFGSRVRATACAMSPLSVSEVDADPEPDVSTAADPEPNVSAAADPELPASASSSESSFARADSSSSSSSSVSGPVARVGGARRLARRLASAGVVEVEAEAAAAVRVVVVEAEVAGLAGL